MNHNMVDLPVVGLTTHIALSSVCNDFSTSSRDEDYILLHKTQSEASSPSPGPLMAHKEHMHFNKYSFLKN